MSTARSKGRRRTTVAALAALLATGLPVTALADGAGGQTRHLTGTLASGADYVIDVPAHWNGTVLLFSHGYRPAGTDNPAADAPDDATRALLLGRGYALAGSSYATTGWAGEQAVPDQLNTLDAFARRVGRARTTLAWGESYGGLVTTALAERHSDRLDGSLSVCGLVHGGVANWNNTLDPVHALKTLLAPGSGTPLVGFRNRGRPRNASRRTECRRPRAQGGERGRARIALAAALHNIPRWNDPALPRPEPGDPADAERAQYPVIQSLVAVPPSPGVRRPNPAQAATCPGTPAWTTRRCCALGQVPQVKVFTRRRDCPWKATCAHSRGPLASARTPRPSPTSSATSTLSGRLRKPQLNIHTTGDALDAGPDQSAYRRAADRGREATGCCGRRTSTTPGTAPSRPPSRSPR